jgi:hypothetical protein
MILPRVIDSQRRSRDVRDARVRKFSKRPASSLCFPRNVRRSIMRRTARAFAHLKIKRDDSGKMTGASVVAVA